MRERQTLYKTLKKRFYLRRQERYLAARYKLCNAPYNSDIYRRLLLKIAESSPMAVVPFLPGGQRSGKVNAYVRHDIDTKKCMENMPLLLEIDKGLNINAGVYFRADDEEYSLKAHQRDIRSYRDAGFEIGLHTVCYTKDAYLAEFRRETEKFADEVGFRPESFSVHGLGDYRLDVRIEFYEYIARHLDEFGFVFGDIPQLRHYHYVIQDCHSDVSGKRFIYDDFLNLPSFLNKGEGYLILTHPCYWIP